MSKYDKEREAMGLQPIASSPSSSTPGISRYAAERDYYTNIPANNVRGLAEMEESRLVNESRQPAPDQKADVETRARQLPVIGPVLRGLDAVAENPIVNKVAELGRMFYVPGAGAANVAGLSNAAGSAVSKLLPGLAGSAAGRIAKTAISEGITGAPIGAAQELMLNPEANGTDLVRGAVLGGAFGAGLGGVAKGLAEGAAKIGGSAAESLARNAIRNVAENSQPELLALPPGRQRGNVNRATTPDVINVPEGQRGLPEASQSSLYANQNINDAKSALSEIDTSLKNLDTSYQEAINDQYKLLKQQRDGRAGIEQGNIIRDTGGNVIDRTGRISNNPQWYQEFYKANGRVPTNKDLYSLAKQHIDEGYTDNGVQIPSWAKENEYAPSKDALFAVKSQMEDSIKQGSLIRTPEKLKDEVLFAGDKPKSKYAAERELILKEQTEQVNPPEDIPQITEQVTQPKELPISQISPFGKKGKFTNPEDTRTYIATKTEREPINFSNMVDKFYEKTVDNLDRVKQFDEHVESVTGEKLSPEERSYYLALNSRGSDMISNHILTERMVDAQGNVVGQSLKDITKQIPRRAYTNFNDYLIAKHAETRMARGETVYDKRTNMTPETVAQKVTEYEKNYPQFKQIADQLYKWNDQMVKSWLVDSGIMTPEMAAAWKEANPFWVPNKRYFSEIEKPGGYRAGARRGFAGQNNPVKGYNPNGSERPVIDPFESLIEYTDKFVKTAKRNEVMQTVIRNLEKDPEALEGFAKLVDQKDFASQKSLAGLNEALKTEGIEGLIAKLDGDFEMAFNKPAKQRIADKGNIITGMVNGKPVAIEVTDPAFLDALTALSPQAQNKVVEIARAATNFMKLFTTGINPIFSLTRNIFRDIPQAYIFSKTTNNPLRFGVDLLDGIVSSFGNKELYQRYKALGGGHSSPVAADRNLLKQSKRELLPQQKKGLGLLPRAYGALENLSNIIESAPRLGEFKRVTKAGGNDYASKVKGLYEANDITTNFKKKGTVVKDADAFYPYLNAAVQGLDKFGRAVKDNPKALAAKAVFAVTVPTLVLYALNYDNPEYEKLSNNVKDNFFLLPKSDGTFVKIPKSRELGVPFGSMLERVMRGWFQKDPESFKGFADTVRNAFVPPGVNGVLNEGLPGLAQDTIMGPLVELASNKNFAGSPIVPGYLEGVSPRNQFDANTSEISKKIGDVLNISPKQIDHLISSYTGVIGQLGIPATNQGATLGSTLVKQVTADPAYSTDATKNFYELKDKVDTVYNDAKLTGVIPEGYNDDVRKYLDRTASDMSDVTKAIRAVDGLILSPQQKKDKKRELTELRNETARKAYQLVHSQK